MKVIEHDTIEYKGRKYPAVLFELETEEDGWVLISTISLERELLSDGKYIDDEAKSIDYAIYFFTDDENIYRDDLAEILRKEMCL